MRRLYTLFIMSLLGMASATAQSNGSGFTEDGYYRVCNYATERYIYVTDNKDYYDKTHDREDFQAIQLWKDINKAISDPASVIFIKKYGEAFDLQAQGTGVKSLTGYYVAVQKQTQGPYQGTYQVSASRGNVTKTLSDDRSNSNPQGKIGTSNTGIYRLWIVDRIETNSATNYFGITPTIEYGGKYYQPFYAVFPFKTASANMHVYYVSKVAGNNVTLTEISGEVPGATPVIIECAAKDPSSNRLEILNTSSAQVTGNKLAGVYFCNGNRPEGSVDAYTEFNASTMRVLTVSGGKLVMTNDAPDRLKEIEAVDWSTEDDINVTCIPANTSYLKAESGTPAELGVRFEGSGIDEILAEQKDASAEGVYTLSGSKLRATNDVKGLPAGLYIVGGLKFVIK